MKGKTVMHAIEEKTSLKADATWGGVLLCYMPKVRAEAVPRRGGVQAKELSGEVQMWTKRARMKGTEGEAGVAEEP